MHLFVDTIGVSLSLRDGVLIIEKDDKVMQEVSFMHLSSIHLTVHCRVSTGVIIECSHRQIPIFVEDNIHISSMVWSPAYSSISLIRIKQGLLSLSRVKYVVIRRLLISKNMKRLELFKGIMSGYHYRRLNEEIGRINEGIKEGFDDNKLRSLEAHASKMFFDVYFYLFPEVFRPKRREHRNAMDIVNMVLNYAFGILYKHVMKSCVYAGVDPYLPLFHQAQYNKPTLVFDLIEPYRPYAERWVYDFFSGDEERIVSLIKEESMEELSQIPGSLKRAFLEYFYDRFSNEVINRNGKMRSMESHIQIELQQFATYLKNLDIEELKKELI
ncbi:MAG: hypothetical protein KatS3mg027_2001 [Bacteroidia bacterium]|nr:MAG: hypothetical protein KatS3mg027_2001 [Bacteroidia bacterium]